MYLENHLSTAIVTRTAPAINNNAPYAAEANIFGPASSSNPTAAVPKAKQVSSSELAVEVALSPDSSLLCNRRDGSARP
jgi:hypothetical protein